MQRTSPISKPQDIANLLASYAREAKAILEQTSYSSSLVQIRNDLQQALDTKFEGKEGEQFFISTLIQILFYGMFSAWVLWHERTEDLNANFNWLEERDTSSIPVISELFFHLSNRKTLEALGISNYSGYILCLFCPHPKSLSLMKRDLKVCYKPFSPHYYDTIIGFQVQNMAE